MLTRGPDVTVTRELEPEKHDTSALTAKSPEALIEEARQRQRRRQLWVVVVLFLLATALVVGVLLSGGSGTSKTGRAGSGREQGHNPVGTAVKKNAVDLAATPNGWVPFAYENAQVPSVPSSWVIERENCGTNNAEPGVIFLDGPCPGMPVCLRLPRCAPTEPNDWVALSSLPYPPASYRGHPTYMVNGYAVYKDVVPYECNSCVPAYDVPSLGVEITGAGTLLPKLLGTLSPSPRDVVLESGQAPTPPSFWRRQSFDGLSVAVPKSWPIEHATFYDDCWFLDNLSDSPSVVLNTGASGVDQWSPSCEDQQGVPTSPVIAAPNGVLIDPGGFRREGTTGSCVNINGLSVCLVTSDPYGELTLSVQVPGRVYPTAVEIGLAGSGQVARTILYSIEKA